MFKEENARIRKAVLDAVEGKPDSLLNKKPSPDAWSPMQILDHLQLMETTIARNISKQLASEKSEKAIRKPIGLTTSRIVKVDAPQHIVPGEEFISLEEMKNLLAASRTYLNGVYDGASKEILHQKSMLHPVFGKVPLEQWFPFVGLHEKRHLKQLVKTLKQLS
ncbi:DinB family protein [Planomicrobium sp. CPCC 101110]|uniref:DinB family protein n=1 Tax=Planomicrobium sp. CPCC 101110 TaxID=2599619 RepID=UPI0011B527D0|nr:DinB family protein [Planomicrobium sp. CPCC 101110]TWT26075.1 DinB family protein [Planomicrobium sp. CPCC 101110]